MSTGTEGTEGPDEELVTDFVDLFHPDAPDVDEGSIAEVFDDLAEALAAEPGGGTAEALVMALGELVEAGAPKLPDAAARLLGLSDRVAGRSRDVLRAGVAMTRAAMAALADRWDEAGRQARLARPLLGTGVLPGAIPVAEQFLAEAAHRAGDVRAAEPHWTAALAGFLEEDRLDGAVVASYALAEIADRAGVDGVAERRWRQTSDLLARDGDERAARECGQRSCRLALAALRSLPDHGEMSAAYERASAAYDLARRRGLPTLAVELLTCVAIAAADMGEPWPEVLALFERNRVECRELTGREPAAQIERYLAAIDLAAGNAAALRGQPFDAEVALRAALPVLRRHGRSVEAAAVERLLEGVREVLERGGGSARGERLIDERLAGPDGQAEHIQVIGRALAASKAVAAGDPDPAEAAVAAIDALLRGSGPPLFHGAVRVLQTTRQLLVAGLTQLRAGPRAAADELADAERRLLAAGSGLDAARVAMGRGHLLAQIDPAAALDALLPAVLALDAVRFNLDGADRRQRAAEVVAAGFHAAYRAAGAAGEPRVLAELLEVARANAVPVAVAGVDVSPTVDQLLAEQPSATPSATPLDGAAALAGPTARTLLGVPARLGAPWGGVALGPHLERARRYLDPVRADVQVDWTVEADA